MAGSGESEGRLTLRRLTDGKHLDPGIYDVRQNSCNVGRIYRAKGDRGTGYAWSVLGTSKHGFAKTLGQAKIELKAALKSD